MNKKAVLSLCLASLLLEGSDLGTIHVESSTIDAKLQTNATEVSNTQTIDKETIEEINPKTIADILNSIPGITYEMAGTDTIKIHIRGVENQNYMGERPGVAMVIDGVPVQETAGRINIDLDNIESIKIIKGGASYLYGNDALAGAVVITTKKPQAKDSTKIETELGSFSSKRFLAMIAVYYNFKEATEIQKGTGMMLM